MNDTILTTNHTININKLGYIIFIFTEIPNDEIIDTDKYNVRVFWKPFNFDNDIYLLDYMCEDIDEEINSFNTDGIEDLINSCQIECCVRLTFNMDENKGFENILRDYFNYDNEDIDDLKPLE